MKQTAVVAFVLAAGITMGALISPLLAQQQNTSSECFVGENSNAACIGNWVYFAGNTSAVDSGAWVVGVNGETGKVWHKDGKRFVVLESRD